MPRLRWALRSGPACTAVSAKASATSNVSSVLKLSTTISSMADQLCERTERRQDSIVRATFFVGTTTETRGCWVIVPSLAAQDGGRAAD